jgi:sucrose-6-phosphate hydrolase SacC (GH32 family)
MQRTHSIDRIIAVRGSGAADPERSATEGHADMHSIRFLGRFINASTVVDSDAQTRPGYNFHLGFTYAPVIVKWDGVYHLFCCSADYSGAGWDQIRHATSADGVSWSEPRIALFTSDSVGERSCCDPSLVRFNDKWYLFYSGNAKDVQTTMFVARADNIDGPYLKYTKRGTWEQNPSDPAVILSPLNPVPDGQLLWCGTTNRPG